jgi:hypothetical protein
MLTPGAPAPWAPPGYGWYCCWPGYVTLVTGYMTVSEYWKTHVASLSTWWRISAASICCSHLGRELERVNMSARRMTKARGHGGAAQVAGEQLTPMFTALFDEGMVSEVVDVLKADSIVYCRDEELVEGMCLA